MVYIEYGGTTVEFEYQISDNKLRIKPHAQYNGEYYLFLTGIDLFNNKRLLSVDGEFLTESFQLQFTITNAEEATEIVDLIEISTPTDVGVEYTKILFGNVFSAIFSKNISGAFQQQIVVDAFVGDVQRTQLTVTNTSTPLVWNNENIVSGYIEQPQNALVYVNFYNVPFDGFTKSFEFVCLTNLKPHINVEYVKKQFGQYQQNVTYEMLYYQQLQQMVRYEEIFNTQIIGVSNITPQQRLFLQKYQHFEVLRTLLTTKQLVAGDSVSIDNFKISYSQLNTATLDYLKDMEKSIIEEHVQFAPTVATRGSQYYDPNIHQKAINALNTLLEYWFWRGQFVNGPIGEWYYR